MALERIPADIRADGGVARMSDPQMIEGIKKAVTIPVMAKARIGHFVEAQVLEAAEVDYIDESEVLTMADEDNHINKNKFTVPFVCGCRNLGEALKDTLGVELPHKATMPRDERGIFRKRPAAPQTIEYCAHDVLYSVTLGTEQRSRILQAACGSDVLDVAYAASDQCSGSCLGRANMFHLYVADEYGILMRPATEDDQMLPVHVSAGTGGRAIAASMLKELEDL